MNAINLDQIKEGDFILSKSPYRVLWRISKITQDETLYKIYELEEISEPASFLETLSALETTLKEPKKMKVAHNYLRHLGELIPKESDEIIKVLFGVENGRE